MQRRQPVDVAGVDVGAARQKRLDLGAVAGRAGGQEDAAVAEPDAARLLGLGLAWLLGRLALLRQRRRGGVFHHI